MEIDGILTCPQYNLRSMSRLALRDDPWTRAWLQGVEPLGEIYHLIRNRRIAVRKEFYETAFMLDRIEPELRKARRLWELGAGHGMLGVFACVLHRNIKQATLVDRREPDSYDKMREQVALRYPFVKIRTRFIKAEINDALGIHSDCLVLGVHACGGLTDLIAETARRAGANFVVVPCCESWQQLPANLHKTTPPGTLESAVNACRVDRWRSWGYHIEERALPLAVTARTRILVGHWLGDGQFSAVGGGSAERVTQATEHRPTGPVTGWPARPSKGTLQQR